MANNNNENNDNNNRNSNYKNLSNRKNMFLPRNNEYYYRGESSSSRNLYNGESSSSRSPAEFNNGEASSSRNPRAHVNDVEDTQRTLMGFGNLGLYDYSSGVEGNKRQNLVQLGAPYTEYVPLADARASPTQNGYEKQIGSNRGMSLYHDQQTLLGRVPAAAASFDTLPNFYPFLGNQIPVNEYARMFDHILESPYGYMTAAETSRCISTLITGCSVSGNWSYIDNLVRSVTRSPHQLVTAACDSQGTCVLQLLIKAAKKRPGIEKVPEVLADATVHLMTNQSGMHVVKQCFVELGSPNYGPLYHKMMHNDNWLIMAVDKNGCRGLNDCIDYMLDSDKTKILDRIAACTSLLAPDIYGNYVLQHVIDMRKHQFGYTENIVKSITDSVETLCTTKNGSHLLEKCLETHFSSLIVRKLADSTKLSRFANHECANYVIQKAIRCSQVKHPALYYKLVNKLCKEKDAMQAHKYGKYVAKLLPDCTREEGVKTVL